MHPLTVNLFRFTVASSVLSALWLRRSRRLSEPVWRVWKTHKWKIIGLGLIGHAGYQVLFILGIKATTAGNAALIISSSPIWTALLARLLGIDRLSLWQYFALLVSFLGVSVVILGGEYDLTFSDTAFLGNMLLLAGAMLWATYTALNKPLLTSGVPALGLTFFSVLVAMPIFILLGLATVAETNWEAVTPTVWIALLFSGGLSTGVAYALWTYAVREVGPSQTAAFQNLVPFVALFAALFLLSEPIRVPQISGGLLIIGGLITMRRL